MSSADVLPRAVDLLAAHASLLAKTRHTQQLTHALLAGAFPAPSRPAPISALLQAPIPDASHTQVPQLTRPPSPPAPKRPLPDRPDLPPAKRARMARYRNYIPEEETIRNDYPQHYVDTGEWPQNWVQGAELERRFEEYPKQRRLLQLKKDAVASSAHPPTYLPFPLAPTPSSNASLLSRLTPLKFDVIVLDPFHSAHTWTWDDLTALPVPQLAGDPSFVFMWVGNGSDDGLEKGREVLAKWGYRRAEDVVWIRTNKGSVKGPGGDEPTTSLLTHTKQHCLVGIRGTVRRSTDAWFVHCNIDTDVIIWAGDAADPTRKPPEMYSVIENFCLGMRRLELFGRPSSLRPGWLTLGEDFSSLDTTTKAQLPAGALEWTPESYERHFAEGVRSVVPGTPEIESLRPKSPTRGNAGGPTLLAPPPNSQRAVPRPALGQPMTGHFPHQNQNQHQNLNQNQNQNQNQNGQPHMPGMPMNQQPRPLHAMQAQGGPMGQPHPHAHPMQLGMMAAPGPGMGMYAQQDGFGMPGPAHGHGHGGYGIGVGGQGMPPGNMGMGMMNPAMGGMGMGMMQGLNPGMHPQMQGMSPALQQGMHVGAGMTPQAMGGMHPGMAGMGGMNVNPALAGPGMGSMGSMGNMGMPMGMPMGNMGMNMNMNLNMGNMMQGGRPGMGMGPWPGAGGMQGQGGPAGQWPNGHNHNPNQGMGNNWQGGQGW